jgi:pimeloyl-ACP methyl ester carboxylesterase
VSTGAKWWGRRLAIVLGTLMVLGYLGVCTLMYVVQDDLLFFPTSLPEDVSARLQTRADVEPLAIEVEGATLRGFLVRGEGEGPRPVLLYFGGNAEPVWHRAEAEVSAAQRSFHRVYVGYRGYDGSTGAPSGPALLSDALAVYDAVARRDDVRSDAIVSFGLSLGTGLATHVARHRPVAGTVLLAPYDRLAEVASEHYPWLPVKTLMRNDIDSAVKAPDIDSPVLIVHGRADRVIPVAHGEALAAVWRGPTELVLLDDVGHNDVSGNPRTQAAIAGFLESVDSTR